MVRGSGRWVLPGVCLAVGYFVGTWQGGLRADPQVPTTAVTPAFTMAHRVAANLFQVTSAEYRACCLQTYHLAGERLDCLLRQHTTNGKCPAVIMDLDETVLDNSAFQTYLYNNKLEYTDALWEVYESKYPHDVHPVPGAIEFIRKAEAKGVEVLYISNRLEKHRDATIKALVKNAIDVRNIEARLGLKGADGSSDKTARRDAFVNRHDVLLYVGDNLRDFSEVFVTPKFAKDAPGSEYEKAIAGRLKAVDDAACHWGIDWFMLPNPVYGEWEKLISNDPFARMRPTSMPTGAPH